jgi:hypothetical protein
MNRNISSVTADQNESTAGIDSKWDRLLRTTTVVIRQNYDYTKVYVGCGCGGGGLAILVLLYCCFSK